MSVSLLFGLLPHWNHTNEGISPILDEISFFCEIFLGFCLNFLYVYENVWWLTSLLKGPVGYHYSPLATGPIISYAFPLWENAKLYILVPSFINLLTFTLSFSLSPTESSKNLSILMLGLWNWVCSIPGHDN